MLVLDWPAVALVAVIGFIVGRIGAVLVQRLPRDESPLPVIPGCFGCDERFRGWAVLPLVGWIPLRGRCRECTALLGWTLPLVEVAVVAGWIYAFMQSGWTWWFLVSALLLSLFIVVSVIDLYWQRIPNALLLGGVVVIAPPALLGGVTGWVEALLGVLACGGFLLLVAWISRGGMGGGDVKFAAVIGLVLGWQMGLVALFLGFLLGALTGLFLMLIRKKDRRDMIAFGPFIAAGATVTMFWGDWLAGMYLITLGV